MIIDYYQSSSPSRLASRLVPSRPPSLSLLIILRFMFIVSSTFIANNTMTASRNTYGVNCHRFHWPYITTLAQQRYE